jgi:hypothetical protein
MNKEALNHDFVVFMDNFFMPGIDNTLGGAVNAIGWSNSLAAVSGNG